MLFYFLKDDRKAADERLKREQEKVDRALQAARNAGNKDREVKELAVQVDNLTVRYGLHLEERLLMSSTVALSACYTSWYIS